MKKITLNLKSLAIIGLSAMALFTTESCSKSSSSAPSVTTPTNPDGATSSNQIEAAALISYFPFSGNANDSIGQQTAAVTGAVTYVPGVIGQAYQGAAGAYITVPATAAYAALQSFSISVWLQVPNAARPTNTGNTGGLFFLSGTQNAGELVLELEHPNTSEYANDSVLIHSGLTALPSASANEYIIPASYYVDTTSSNPHWVNFVESYNASTSTLIEYINGIAIGVNTAWSIPNGSYPTSNILQNTTVTPNVNLGNVGFSNDAPTTITIGTWPTAAGGLFGVSNTNTYLGAMDELRVYNAPLSAADAASLYILGSAGL